MAVHPAARRRPKPGSGPRRHDGCGYFIASVTHRRTFPVPQPRCVIASERWCYAARPAELTPSKTAPATLRRLQSSIHHLLRRSAHHSPAPPRRQIAIDGHRGFLPWRLSDAGPQHARIGHDGPPSETLHRRARSHGRGRTAGVGFESGPLLSMIDEGGFRGRL